MSENKQAVLAMAAVLATMGMITLLVFYPVATVALLLIPVITVVVLAFLSIRIIPADKVGLVLKWGKPQETPWKEVEFDGGVPCDEKVLESGFHMVPYIPIKIGGYRPWELVLFPKKMFQLSFEKEGEKFWSKDRQILFPYGTLMLQLPYKFSEFLANLLERNVPFQEEEELRGWTEDMVMRALRDVLSRKDYRRAIAADGIDEISAEVNKWLMKPTRPLYVAGIYGNSPDDPTEGTGYAHFELEQILLTDELQQKEQSVKIAEVDIEVAGNEAKAKAERVAAVDRAMDAWVLTQAKLMGKDIEDPKQVAEALASLKADGSHAKQRSLYMAQILEGDKIFVGNPDGTPLSGELGPGIAFASALAGLFGGRRQDKKPGGNPGGKNPGPGPDGSGKGPGGPRIKSQREAAQAFFEKHGVYPDWDPDKREPHN